MICIEVESQLPHREVGACSTEFVNNRPQRNEVEVARDESRASPDRNQRERSKLRKGEPRAK